MAKFEELLRAAEQTEICISSVPGFTRPTQRRTQIKTDLMVASAAFLLQNKPFSEVSIQDIASGAGCSVTSIYARFEDKMALLRAVHLITLQHYRTMISTRMKHKLFVGSGIHDFSNEFVNVNIDFFEENKHFFRAAIFNDINYIYERIDAATQDYAIDVAPVVSRLIGRDQYSIVGSLALAIRVIISICRDGAVGGLQFGASDRLAFARLFAMILDEGVEGARTADDLRARSI